MVANGEDDTEEIARQYPVTVIHVDKRLGKGGAILEGFKHTTGNWVLFADVDGAVSFDQLTDLPLDPTYPLYLASRYLPHSRTIGYPFYRKILSKLYRFYVNRLFGYRVPDYQCGFKLVRRDLLEDLAPKMKCMGFAFDTELIVRTIKAGYEPVSFPVVWKHGKGSKVRLKDVWRMAKEVQRIHEDTR